MHHKLNGTGLFLSTIALLLLFALRAAPAKATAIDVCQTAGSLVVNCGFETGTLSGWTFSAANIGSDFSISETTPFSGAYAADFGAAGTAMDFISQSINTVPGAEYHLAFWLKAPGGNTSSQFVAQWDGSDIFSAVYPFSTTYEEITATLTATATQSLLSFGGNNPPSWWYLDSITLTQVSSASTASAVPAPYALSLFIVALSLMVCLKPKRRAKTYAV